MSTVVTLVDDAYPFGCKGDVRNLDDKELAELKKLQAKRSKKLFEVSKDEPADEPKSDVSLSEENFDVYVSSHSRRELDDEAVKAGVEDVGQLTNKAEVAKAIIAKRAE